MKKLMLGVALSLLVFSACNSNGGGSYTLKGDLTNLKDSVLYLAQQGNSMMPKMDTIRVKDGKFTFTGKAEKPVFAQIITADQRSGFPLFLEAGTIHITGNADSMAVGKIKVTGTPDNDDLHQLMDIQQPFIHAMMGLQSAFMQAKMSNDSDAITHIQNSADSIQNAATVKIQSFIKNNPKSLVSAFALQNMMDDLDDSTLNQLYSSLDTAVQHSVFGEPIGTKLASERKTAVGQMAPDFTMNDTTGNPVSLSSFRGKYVLVDFWASWCGPCRAENPNVVKAYNEYKGKNFTILGVSLDKTKDAWEKAIKDDHLAWNQVSDLQYWDNAAAKLYGVQAIPANFLIGPDGKIVAKNLRGDALENELSKILQ
ncbi:MAG: AhpC/TSA family protein [Chitinophagaceae bacterium]|nr:MAG: AhpC/TSA family protein [Chitinophagaceae bacterium]